MTHSLPVMVGAHQSSQTFQKSAAVSRPALQPYLLQQRQPGPCGVCGRTKRQSFTRTHAVQEQKPEVAKVADSIGLPTEEGLFGFKPFAEVWVGRLAMAGFATSCVMEFITGKGSAQQVGLLTPNPALLLVIGALASGATVFAFGRTLGRARSGSMSPTELLRYGGFLGLSNEAGQISETETEMKQGWKSDRNDTPPQSLAGSASDNPTDTFKNEEARSTPKAVTLPEDRQFLDPGMRYARDVELSNGRAAMLGFLGTLAVEAATGKGILSQVIWYLKLVNILGPKSGF